MVLEEGWFPKTKSAAYFKFVKDDLSAPQHSWSSVLFGHTRQKSNVCSWRETSKQTNTNILPQLRGMVLLLKEMLLNSRVSLLFHLPSVSDQLQLSVCC